MVEFTLLRNVKLYKINYKLLTGNQVYIINVIILVSFSKLLEFCVKTLFKNFTF